MLSDKVERTLEAVLPCFQVGGVFDIGKLFLEDIVRVGMGSSTLPRANPALVP